MKPLPKKISPDRIRDAIVQVFFSTEIPPEPLVGFLFSVLGSRCGLEYSNRPLLHKRPEAPPLLPASFEVQIPLSPTHVFFNDDIKVHLLENSLVFNCVQGYIGWKNYFLLIGKVLRELSEQGIITSFHRVGIRYTSEFANIDIWEHTKFAFTLYDRQTSFLNGNFNLSWFDEPHRIILNLGSKSEQRSLLNHEVKKIKFLSLIDVDVIHENFEIKDPKEYLDIIDKAHKKEKEIFFDLLKPEFLKTLKPEYD